MKKDVESEIASARKLTVSSPQECIARFEELREYARSCGDATLERRCLHHLNAVAACIKDLQLQLYYALQLAAFSPDANIYDQLGRLHWKMGKPDLALQCYRQALKYPSATGLEHESAENGIARCLGQAEPHPLQPSTDGLSEEALFQADLSVAMFSLGRFADARDALDRATAITPLPHPYLAYWDARLRSKEQ